MKIRISALDNLEQVVQYITIQDLDLSDKPEQNLLVKNAFALLKEEVELTQSIPHRNITTS